MHQGDQQPGLTPGHANAKAEESDSSSDSDRKEPQLDTAMGKMNFKDIMHNTNKAPHEQYEGIGEWPLSPGATSPSQATTKIFPAGFTFSPGTGMSPGISEMNLGTGGYEYEGQYPAGLTPDEQANDASYRAMLVSPERNAAATALADGRIQEPHLHDVLCGRGGSINSHPGNRVFRGWIAERRQSYNLAESKADKSRITSEVMGQVQEQKPQGRFLQKITDGNTKRNDPYNIGGWWMEIDDMKALAKISQALREGAPAFRALHKKGRKKQQQQSKPSQRASSRRKPKKKEVEHELSPGDKRKASPPRTKSATPSGMNQNVASMPPLPMDTGNVHELDVLFPTTNNFFATENHSNGNLLNSYPLVHLGDYTASMDEVAGAIPPTPPTAKKRRPSLPNSSMQAKVKLPGKCTTPGLPPTPHTPLVSPGFSPYGEAKAAWDAISFLPNSNSRGTFSPIHKKPILQRVHSLSFSEADAHSVGSFNDPFENDNHGNHKKGPPEELEREAPDPSHFPNQAVLSGIFPPPLMALGSSAHGLSFGGIGPVPGGGNGPARNSRPKSTYRRESSLSSKSWASISNLKNSKRKSIS